MDIRGRRLRKPDDGATRFISSTSADASIAGEVVLVNRAHMVALVRGGEVIPAIGARSLKFLGGVETKISPGSLAEDYHQLLEQRAVDALGVEVAGYLNLGKSRNDQVATAIRMHLRGLVLEVLENATRLQGSLLALAKRWGNGLLPGFTHLQHAQPVTIAHHLFAYFDRTQRDVERVMQLYGRVNLSPMGGAALAGTSVNIDRTKVAELLGFSGVVENAMDAVSSRDVELEALACFAIAISGLSRIAEEMIVWSTLEFSFVELPDEFAASSSIMPQKKNPVVAEMVRAKSGSVLGDLSAALAIVKALPYSYNLDLQEVTPHLWSAAEATSDSFLLMGELLKRVKFDNGKIAESMKDDFSTATSLADFLVREHKVSFRQAHSIVGALVRKAIANKETLAESSAHSMGKLSREIAGKEIKMTRKTLQSVLLPSASLRRIGTQGGSNPAAVGTGLSLRNAKLRESVNAFGRLRAGIASSERLLDKSVAEISREVKN